MGLNIFYFGQDFAEFFDLLKHFVIWLSGGMILHPWEIDSLEIYTLGRLTHRSIRLRGNWQTGLLCSGEIDSPEYSSPGRLTHWAIMLWGDWLTGVFDSGEIDSPDYYISGRLNRWVFRQFPNLSQRWTSKGTSLYWTVKIQILT